MKIIYIPCSNKACNWEIAYENGEQPAGKTFCEYCVNGVAPPLVDNRPRFQETQFDPDIPRGTEYIDLSGGNKVDTRAPDVDEESGDAE